MVDRFGRNITSLRLSVTDLCNQRCRYCMPAEGVCKKSHDEMLTEDEMITAVEAAASLGITKLRITGGEPLVKKNILSLCRRAAAVPGIRDLALTTNGTMLDRLAAPLRDAGVSRLNISLDTLNADKYAWITRTGSLDDTVRGIRSALSAGFEKIKLNAVLIGGFNDNEIVSLAELTVMYPLDMRFIELMPMTDAGFSEDAYIPCSKVLELLSNTVYEGNSGVAELYRLPGAQGNIGLINTISRQFCGQCSRLRLTADGMIKPCLHSPDEYPVKGLNMEQMTDQFRTAILGKPEWRGELSFVSHSRARRGMNQIGG